MALRTFTQAKNGALAVNNVEMARDPKLTATQKVQAQQAFFAVAEMLDAIASKQVTHITIGTPRSGGSFLVTINVNGAGPIYVGCANVLEMGEALMSEAFAPPTG